MATHKPFREVVPPGANFDFIGKIRIWVLISVVLIGASVAALLVNKELRGDYLNWTIDFKGGTEMIFAFEDPSGAPVEVGPGKVRSALKGAGKSGIDVSDFTWTYTGKKGTEHKAHGMLVRTPEFSAVSENHQQEIADALVAQFPEAQISSATWSGDRIFVRSKKPLSWDAARAFFAERNLELKPWGEQTEAFTTPVEGTGEYNAQLAIKGIGSQYQKFLQKDVGKGIVVKLIQVDAVGAKAGARLRNDGIKSLFYAMVLIMLYLAFRFDVRYAPGAVFALLHDAILVVGVFAATWQPVSLTSVAALLTVIGYSVNDSVIIFDRIRENVGKLKDKKFSRIINISINETLARTILTSTTTFVAALMMNIFGSGLVRNFAFAMNVGIVVGTYSSIFIASPIALAIHNRWFASAVDLGKPSRSATRRGKKPGSSKKPSGSGSVEEAVETEASESVDAGDNKPKRRGPARRNKKKRRKR